MANIENISVEDFKTLFVKEFPYLPVWIEGKAYFTNDVVYYESNFYNSLIDANLTTPQAGDDWALYNDNADNYISESDIQRAFAEAKTVFPLNLMPDNATAKLLYLYLTAHYLVIDINNALNSLSMGFQGFTQSKSVGSVSESYGIPQWILNNPVYGQFAQTGFGRKYLSLLMPYLKAAALPILSKGRVTCGW